MNPRSICRIQDALSKLQSKTKLVKGGDQYTPEVSLAVAAANRPRGLLRTQKPEGVRPLPLRELARRK